jgi:hypothetical protein
VRNKSAFRGQTAASPCSRPPVLKTAGADGVCTPAGRRLTRVIRQQESHTAKFITQRWRQG